MNDYLNMRLDYGKKGKVHITTPKHTKSILEASVEEMDGIAETQEANHMLPVRQDGDTLTSMQENLFRTVVAKILFVSCRSRP